MAEISERRKRFQVVFSCAFLLFLPIITFGAPLYVPVIQEWLARIDFDSEAWKDPKNSTWSNPLRIRMVDDLLWEYDLEGMTSEEVTELLGPTDKTDYFSSWDFVYWLGPERGFFSIDSEWLVLKLDAEGKVREYKIETD
ncbi:MAG: hypothetical protein KC940_11165 [Candidatus Omnitrophica bacterium]|nr:hypothetical protein [Candidatus Omnitrophota bacterium]MCA9434406.1 hypothetical protein [Candidatus Omnitrophota bacterium]MCB9784617.1 hypothetical protein [Candidatus Omnitrophota bacterium]